VLKFFDIGFSVFVLITDSHVYLTELNEIIYAGAHRQPNITGCFMTEWKFKQEGQQICLYGPVAMVFICFDRKLSK
jgi:hypothetical protein